MSLGSPTRGGSVDLARSGVSQLEREGLQYVREDHTREHFHVEAIIASADSTASVTPVPSSSLAASRSSSSSRPCTTDSPPQVLVYPDTCGADSSSLELFSFLPHPRHDHPCAFLVVQPPPPPQEKTRESRSPSPGPPRLLELHAHSPPQGFAQTFFIGDALVLPQNRTLLATPVDLHFVLLRALWEGDETTHSDLQSGKSSARTALFRSTEEWLPAPQPPFSTASGGKAARSSGPFGSTREKEDDPFHDFEATEGEVFEDGDAFFASLRSPPSRWTSSTAVRSRREAPVPFHRKRMREEADDPLRVDESPGAVEDNARPSSVASRQRQWYEAWRARAGEVLSATTAPAPGNALARVLSALRLLLPDFCEAQRPSHGGVGPPSTELYYRFSLRKAAVWCARRIRRVAQSAALSAFLQLPSPTAATDGAGTEAEDARTALLEESAAGLVAEYVCSGLLCAMRDALCEDPTAEPTPAEPQSRWESPEEALVWGRVLGYACRSLPSPCDRHRRSADAWKPKTTAAAASPKKNTMEGRSRQAPTRAASKKMPGTKLSSGPTRTLESFFGGPGTQKK